jgi:hypothetical protein
MICKFSINPITNPNPSIDTPSHDNIKKHEFRLSNKFTKNTIWNMWTGERNSIPLQGTLSEKRREFNGIGTTDNYGMQEEGSYKNERIPKVIVVIR